MSLVIHKYMPEDMSEAELEGTFAAREHTLDYLVQALRDQIGSASPSSFLISGPRGAGKSTLLRMVRLRIRQDPELAAAWLPIPFPENQYHVASLRDLLAGGARDSGPSRHARRFNGGCSKWKRKPTTNKAKRSPYQA